MILSVSRGEIDDAGAAMTNKFRKEHDIPEAA
jgi:hypothetical protein